MLRIGPQQDGFAAPGQSPGGSQDPVRRTSRNLGAGGHESARSQTTDSAGCLESQFEQERVTITNLRHKQCLVIAREQLGKAVKAYQEGLSEEMPLYNLRKTLGALDELTGETTTDDILRKFFPSFCIGK